jgi:hypothetical protein
VHNCVNPAHLYAGTEHLNHLDMWQRTRSHSCAGLPRGAKHHRAVLTTEAAAEIRRRRECDGTYINTLAAQYGVSRDTILRILAGTHWSTQ